MSGRIIYGGHIISDENKAIVGGSTEEVVNKGNFAVNPEEMAGSEECKYARRELTWTTQVTIRFRRKNDS